MRQSGFPIKFPIRAFFLSGFLLLLPGHFQLAETPVHPAPALFFVSGILYSFVPSFGNRPRNLVGREEILHAFEEALQSTPGSRESAMLLLGQRGSGKTVLLLEFAEIAIKRGYIVASPTTVRSRSLLLLLPSIKRRMIS